MPILISTSERGSVPDGEVCGPFAIHNVVHNGLPMTCGAVRALSSRSKYL